MIFVTVGTQLSFDRLISAVDQWASKNPGIDIYAQVGPTDSSPKNIKYSDFLSPDKADELFKKSSLIVSHAGMGSILTALKYKKPILIMPRRASLGEHRNDHQLATAKWLGDSPGVTVAWDEKEIDGLLDNRNALNGGDGICDHASPELINYLKKIILKS